MGLAHNQPSKINQFKINNNINKNLYEEYSYIACHICTMYVYI